MRVPELRERYLDYIKEMSERWLDWERFSELAEYYQSSIKDIIAVDNHKHFSTEEFTTALTVDDDYIYSRPGSPPGISLKSYVEQRREFLLSYINLETH